jgi:hypothetical protein
MQMLAFWDYQHYAWVGRSAFTGGNVDVHAENGVELPKTPKDYE